MKGGTFGIPLSMTSSPMPVRWEAARWGDHVSMEVREAFGLGCICIMKTSYRDMATSSTGTVAAAAVEERKQVQVC